MGKGRLWPPNRIDTPWPITKTFVTGDYVGHLYTCTKFGANSSTENFCANGWSILTKVFLFTYLFICLYLFPQAHLDVRALYLSWRVHFGILKFKINTWFFSPPPNSKFSPKRDSIFSRKPPNGKKNLTCKRPLIFIVASSKLYSGKANWGWGFQICSCVVLLFTDHVTWRLSHLSRTS